MHKTLALWVIAAVFLQRCDLPSKHERISNYFRLDSLVAVHQGRLIERGASIEKEVNIAEQRESRTFTFDSMAWVEELAFMDDFDPSQSRYVNMFTETTDDNQLVYQIKEIERPGLQSFQAEFDGTGNPVRITAEIFEQTSIYSARRALKLDFDRGALTRYETWGFQKMVLRDTVAFRSSVKIID